MTEKNAAIMIAQNCVKIPRPLCEKPEACQCVPILWNEFLVVLVNRKHLDK